MSWSLGEFDGLDKIMAELSDDGYVRIRATSSDGVPVIVVCATGPTAEELSPRIDYFETLMNGREDVESEKGRIDGGVRYVSGKFFEDGDESGN